jgi:hypothetical protein
MAATSKDFGFTAALLGLALLTLLAFFADPSRRPGGGSRADWPGAGELLHRVGEPHLLSS